jgi:hypothetical protein
MMGALRGLAAGLGEGLMASGRLFGEAALAEQRASLELEKTKALEQFRIEQVGKERERIGGIVASARSSAMDDGPVTPAMQDRSAVKSLAESGYIDQASALDKVYESGTRTTPWGSVTHDSSGNVVFDNASDLKSELERRRAEEKATATAAKNAPKPITQQQLDSITTQVDKIVTNNLSGTKNPFAMPGEDPKSAADSAKQNLMSTALGKMAVNAAQKGETMNPNEGFSQLKTVVDKFDAKVTADARANAGTYFDDKGRPKDGTIAALQKRGVPDDAVQDKVSFMRWYRDAKLSDMNEFNRFRKGDAPKADSKPPKADDKPAAKPEQKPDPKPAPAPEKRPIVSAARNADAFGTNFSERQKTLIERQQQADADPELQRLMEAKNKALRDNKPVLANNALAQYNQLRKERYGL